MQKIYIFIALLCIAFPWEGNAQSSSQNVYPLLDIATNPSTKALGGVVYGDIETNFGVANFAPSELDSTYHKKIETNVGFLFQDTKHIVLNGGWAWDNNNIFALTFQTINYGDFERRDSENTFLGNYSAASYDFAISYSKKLSSKFNAGISLHTLWSKFDIYNSNAIAFTASTSYNIKNFSATLALRNVGTQFSSYNGNKEKLPLDLGVTLVKSLDHAPFIFYVTAHHLTQWDKEIESDDKETKNDYSNWFNHINLGTRLRLSTHFAAMIGYNNNVRESIGVTNKKGASGWSLGFQVDIKRLQFAYSYTPMHLNNSQHNIGLQIKL